MGGGHHILGLRIPLCIGRDGRDIFRRSRGHLRSSGSYQRGLCTSLSDVCRRRVHLLKGQHIDHRAHGNGGEGMIGKTNAIASGSGLKEITITNGVAVSYKKSVHIGNTATKHIFSTGSGYITNNFGVISSDSAWNGIISSQMNSTARNIMIDIAVMESAFTTMGLDQLSDGSYTVGCGLGHSNSPVIYNSVTNIYITVSSGNISVIDMDSEHDNLITIPAFDNMRDYLYILKIIKTA